MTKPKLKQVKKITKEQKISFIPVDQKFIMTKSPYKVFIKWNTDTIELLSMAHHGNFIFKSYNKPETIKRWRKIIALMQEAINYIELL